MRCMICGSTDSVTTHHLLCGSNRRAADRHGLTIPLCSQCHDRVQTDGQMMAISKAIGQLLFMLGGRSRREFLAEFGQDYLYRLQRDFGSGQDERR